MAEDNKRKSISKKKRFEVFKRDNFTCQYCSAKPPKVPLEVDHIVPVAKGGENEMDNLITACFDCNRGKSDVLLDAIPEALAQRNERKRLAVEQHSQYKRLLKREKKLINEDIDYVEEVFSTYHDDYVFTDKFRISVKTFISKLGVEEVRGAMEKACIKTRGNSDSLRYFCGICWNKIRGDE